PWHGSSTRAATRRPPGQVRRLAMHGGSPRQGSPRGGSIVVGTIAADLVALRVDVGPRPPAPQNWAGERADNLPALRPAGGAAAERLGVVESAADHDLAGFVDVTPVVTGRNYSESLRERPRGRELQFDDDPARAVDVAVLVVNLDRGQALGEVFREVECRL